MLEFKDFKILDENDLLSTSIKFRFTDDELSEDSFEYIHEKLKEYELYLEYDCKGVFNIEYEKEVIIEMIITFPSRKIPESKKGLEEFVNKHVVDFSEYYYRVNNFGSLVDDELITDT